MVVVILTLIGLAVGWKALLSVLSLLRPSARHAYGAKGAEFLRAWESLNGPMVRGVRASQPPAGSFQSWLRANRATGVSAEEWLREGLSQPTARRNV